MNLSTLATQYTGSPSGFREISKITGISVFDPEAKVTKLANDPEVKKLLDQYKKTEAQVNQLLGQIRKVADDKVSLDWLMN